ncbi:ferredoxin [Kutzneria sp. NPDC052558]|uniref:ferredoxin n=1 Tax=Kutzneria sp. NPDC052558 TaxID=3364121 RepID=UPI0037CAD023
MRVTADLDLCQGHAMCVVEAPDVFAYDKAENKVRVLDERPDESRRAAVLDAVRYCPTGALSLDDGTENTA